MCGIVGYHSLRSNNLLEKKFLNLLNKINHRGPDEKNYFIKDNVSLGHTRLSIQDITYGTQPMWDSKNDLCIIYNGEIYNHLSLRNDLKKNFNFKSKNSDTETIIYAYKKWGINFLNKLNGMYSIVIYDKIKQEILLIRDKFGEKPLYYYQDKDLFSFSSELNKLISTSNNISTLNLCKYFTYGYVPYPNTIYENIFSVKPGEIITYDLKENIITKKTFYSFRSIPDKSLINKEEEISEELKRLVNKSINERMISDVPVGIALSGGLDSSIIASKCKDFKNISSHSITFSEKTFDESYYSKKIAKLFSLNHFEYNYNQESLFKLIDEAYENLDTPISDPSFLCTYALFKSIKSNKVILTGDGADELFGGYDFFSAIKKLNLLKKYIPINLSEVLYRLIEKINVGNKNLPLLLKIKRGLKYVISNKKSISYQSSIGPCDLSKANNILGSSFKDYEVYDEIINEFNNNYYCYEDAIDFFCNYYLSNGIFTKTDRASMFNSIEARSIFTDNEIVDLAQKIPFELKFKNGEKKYILKKAFRKSVPEEIIFRKKKGFGIPVDSILKSANNKFENSDPFLDWSLFVIKEKMKLF